ncbi:MAG: hypothetical protein OXC42_03405 [Gammaproteobacteria bacterium]|nr:hypothetical protein [Gammaproteobacteria bacterium]
MSNTINAKLLAMNLIRYIGDQVSEAGQPIDQLSGVAGMISAPNEEISNNLVEELEDIGLLRIGKTISTFDGRIFMNVNLSLEGWEKYEKEKHGDFEGNYGFIAMEFGDVCLDKLFREVMKPAIQEQLNIDLVNLEDVAQAGVIDDIMRAEIRGAIFVIADLTHDNYGAYWEAGYAEGLGKPVIYICEKEKFEEKSTHFDVNHCTTVPWSMDDPDEFCDKLIAVLRQSIQL